MTVINLLNVNTPFLQGVPNSLVSPEWLRLLSSVVTAVTNTSSNTALSAAVADLQGYSFAQRKGAPDLTQRVNDIEAQVQRRPSLPALLAPDDGSGISRSRTASAANSVAVVDDVTTNGTMYPVFSNGTGGARQLNTSSTVWTFNPSTGRVTSTQLYATASVAALSATSIPVGGTAGAGFLVSSTANFGVFFGSGAPTLSAAKGSLYLRSDGTTTNDRMYVNTNGSTTWTAVTTAA